ncbi:hypothetical protein VAE151_500303 [Vibrio aestuarianus]|uniref:Uncharacterized protein n=1 Tax=Vibrio aestuarianus TaxID=28171 RepID=A0ABN8TNK0_9VIBR|nr:hypothetical protein VAE032_220304 [Vibrio aestuarianus]CAH8184328.1 hypothetical protein VAE055_320305 [Vibrio aestuarianus]CAH8184421.1 hypothetical protein VAE128_420305 [Vibrio aestuarianus]CAH8184456.1 hypothetical protein VAE130_530303 [Vibrio aestuarianus]CAH8184545.1 hypothetical protein VAE115_270305 [Vibrio aestuarianus]
MVGVCSATWISLGYLAVLDVAPSILRFHSLAMPLPFLPMEWF